jgi:hypothetical protein
VFLPDMIVTAMLQRSYGVVDALIDAVDTYNMHAAAPLLRLQFDTLFRAHYIASGPDLDDLTNRLLRGEEFRRIRDAEGENLTDEERRCREAEPRTLLKREEEEVRLWTAPPATDSPPP